MKKTKTPRSHTRSHTKRHGKHHKQSRNYIKTYAPYLPIVVSIIASVFLSAWQPHTSGTLAYATEMGASGLLSVTNNHRTNNGQTPLTLNGKLASSAQAKANDMALRGYWSHNTPEGQEPWVFIDAANYSYTKAGENLAYGFGTSAQTIAGWMNSATHRANMLDSAYTEVGFGYKNTANFCYQGDHDNNPSTPATNKCFGNQTIVVAHYGKPRVAAATTSTTPTANSAGGGSLSTTPSAAAQTTPSKKMNNTKTNDKKKSAKETKAVVPVSTDQPLAAASAKPQDITKIQALTNGRSPWMIGLVAVLTCAALIVFLLRYSLKARHLLHDLIKDTERFVLHHPLLDSILISLVILGTTLLRTTGTIL